MIPIAIKLFMGGLLKRLTAAFAWATASTAHLLIVALCVSLAGNAWLFWGRQAARVSAAKWEIAYNKALQASDANHAAQMAQVAADQAKFDQTAKDNANVETQIRTVYVDRGGAYADRMRFDKTCVRPAGPASEGNLAALDNGPGPDSVVLSRSDFDTLTGNTARLVAVHQWGEDLIAAGLATAGD